MQQKEKTMFQYNVRIYYIKNNNKEEKAFTFDSHSEFKKFFDYMLDLKYNENSNIYDMSWGVSYIVDTMSEAINRLLLRSEVLLPGASAFINMELEKA